MIPAQIIYEWQIQAPWPDNDDVEQDLILTRMLCAIYENPFLSGKLAFRGGTCLNKLFWSKPVRYSEDLDFVQVNSEPVGKTVTALREILDPLFEKKGTWEAREHSYRILYTFPCEIGGGKRRIKIEINTREHLALDGYRKKAFLMESRWHSGQCEIVTFSPEEILATKLKALYQRRKGRDLFDLWKSRELNPNWEKVVSLFLEYLKRFAKPVPRDLLKKNLQDKLNDPRFQDDTRVLVLDRGDYKLERAAQFVLEDLFSRIPESKTKRRNQTSQIFQQKG
jgi:predicted nucleotidyltransferase component of viral defense system